MMKRKISGLVLLLLLLPFSSQGQCSMCRAVLESQADQSTAEGINNGIVYLMIFPYILIGAICFFIYRTLRRKSAN